MLYNFVVERTDIKGFKHQFKPTDLTFLVEFHSSSKDGYLSFTDFNQMVLPACNHKLRAEVTQRKNIFSDNLSPKRTSEAERRLTELLVAEICLNLDL